MAALYFEKRLQTKQLIRSASWEESFEQPNAAHIWMQKFFTEFSKEFVELGESEALFTVNVSADFIRG